MAATFGGAVGPNAPAVVDTNASQATGAATQGIGLKGADDAELTGARRIGALLATDELVFETLEAPAPPPPP